MTRFDEFAEIPKRSMRVCKSNNQAAGYSGCFFFFCEVRVMQYTIKCEKCGRPGTIEKRTTDKQQPTRTTTTYKKTCVACGGKVRALLD